MLTKQERVHRAIRHCMGTGGEVINEFLQPQWLWETRFINHLRDAFGRESFAWGFGELCSSGGALDLTMNEGCGRWQCVWVDQQWYGLVSSPSIWHIESLRHNLIRQVWLMKFLRTLPLNIFISLFCSDVFRLFPLQDLGPFFYFS